MNANRLLLAIIPASGQTPRIWNTGIEIDSVRGISQDTEISELKVRSIERFRDEQQVIKERQAIYAIRYDVDPAAGSVADAIRILKEATP